MPDSDSERPVALPRCAIFAACCRRDPRILAFGPTRAGGREETDMSGYKISRVAANGTGTTSASWTAVFLARGLSWRL